MLKSVFLFLLLVVFCGGGAGQKAGRVKVSGTVKTTDGVLLIDWGATMQRLSQRDVNSIELVERLMSSVYSTDVLAGDSHFPEPVIPGLKIGTVTVILQYLK